MILLTKIQEDIKNLPEKDFNNLKDWIQNLAYKKWDIQISEDIKTGKLDELADSAILDFKNGKRKSI